LTENGIDTSASHTKEFVMGAIDHCLGRIQTSLDHAKAEATQRGPASALEGERCIQIGSLRISFALSTHILTIHSLFAC
jgi:hypothetical protein